MEYFIGRLARPLVGGDLLCKTSDTSAYQNHQTLHMFRDWSSLRFIILRYKLGYSLRLACTHVVAIRDSKQSHNSASELHVILVGLRYTHIVNEAGKCRTLMQKSLPEKEYVERVTLVT